MNIQTEKLDLIQWVLQLTDNRMLERLKELRMEKSAISKGKGAVKLSSLRGKASGMSNEEIDAQLNSLRDEWTRNI
ncbi:MAG: hypothetical protein K9J06_04260 [Flavobacteriales bacterium]|nr:hypothetical protein [Flavobacteriales bacterium]